jgi:hypothetical protein
MPTTTNFGWTTPADTDLVKDGAAAIRTLAGNIDTSLVDLKGGTTGQVLSKNSNTDLDFTFTTLPVTGMTLINTGGTTLTGATVTISSIPTTYKNLQLVIQNFKPANDGTNISMRFNGDSGSNRHKTLASFASNDEVFNSTSTLIGPDTDNSVSQNQIIVDIPDYANTTTWKQSMTRSIAVNHTNNSNMNWLHYAGFYNQTSAITSLSFFCGSGNFTSGTAYLYGVS